MKNQKEFIKQLQEKFGVKNADYIIEGFNMGCVAANEVLVENLVHSKVQHQILDLEISQL